MFCWHRWSKWRLWIATLRYPTRGTPRYLSTGEFVEEKEPWEWRRCEKCGKTQARRSAVAVFTPAMLEGPGPWGPPQ